MGDEHDSLPFRIEDIDERESLVSRFDELRAANPSPITDGITDEDINAMTPRELKIMLSLVLRHTQELKKIDDELQRLIRHGKH